MLTEDSRVKKVLAVLIVFFVVVLALVGALSVIPHAHGADFNHSKHPTCPIYQLNLHAFVAALVSFGCIVFFVLVWRLCRRGPDFIRFCFSFFNYLRAPPAFPS